MKFSNTLETSCPSEWKAACISYKALDKLIRDIALAIEAAESDAAPPKRRSTLVHSVAGAGQSVLGALFRRRSLEVTEGGGAESSVSAGAVAAAEAQLPASPPAGGGAAAPQQAEAAATKVGANSFLALLNKKKDADATDKKMDGDPAAAAAAAAAPAPAAVGPVWPTGKNAGGDAPKRTAAQGFRLALQKKPSLWNATIATLRAAPPVISVQVVPDPDFSCFGKEPLPTNAPGGPFGSIVATVSPVGALKRPLVAYAEERAFFEALDDEVKCTTFFVRLELACFEALYNKLLATIAERSKIAAEARCRVEAETSDLTAAGELVSHVIFNSSRGSAWLGGSGRAGARKLPLRSLSMTAADSSSRGGAKRTGAASLLSAIGGKPSKDSSATLLLAAEEGRGGAGGGKKAAEQRYDSAVGAAAGGGGGGGEKQGASPPNRIKWSSAAAAQMRRQRDLVFDSTAPPAGGDGDGDGDGAEDGDEEGDAHSRAARKGKAAGTTGGGFKDNDAFSVSLSKTGGDEGDDEDAGAFGGAARAARAALAALRALACCEPCRGASSAGPTTSGRSAASLSESSALDAALKRDAQRLHRALIEAYRAVDLLATFASVNCTAVTKILKKHDKHTNRATQGIYLSLVDRSALASAEGRLKNMLRGIEREFVALEVEMSADAAAAREKKAAAAAAELEAEKEDQSALAAAVQGLRAFFFAPPSKQSQAAQAKKHAHLVRRRAIAKLRPLPSLELAPRALTLGVFLVGGCCCAVAVVIWLLWRASRLPGTRSYTTAIVPVVRGPLLVLLHVALQGFVVAGWDAGRVSHAFIFGGTPGSEMRYEEYLLLAGIAGTAWLVAWAWILTRLVWRVEGTVAACGTLFQDPAALRLSGAWALAHPLTGVNCTAVAASAGIPLPLPAPGALAQAAGGPEAAAELARRLDEASGRAAVLSIAAEPTEALLPAVLLGVLVLLAIAPVPETGPLSRAWPRRASRAFFFRSVFYMLCAPLARVRLPDFFIADQIVSQPLALSDLLYTGCYYASGTYRSGASPEAGVCLSRSPGALAIPVALGICLAPYWIRILQCLRRLVDEGHKQLHVANTGKYAVNAVAACLRLVAVWHPGPHRPGATDAPLAVLSSYRGAAFAASVVAVLYAFLWDLKYDWGLLKTGHKLPGLRKSLIYRRPSVYYGAIIVNAAARCLWVLPFVLTSAPAPGSPAPVPGQTLRTVLAVIEIGRRALWNFFRLENEQVANQQKFKAYTAVQVPRLECRNFGDEKQQEDQQAGAQGQDGSLRAAPPPKGGRSFLRMMSGKGGGSSLHADLAESPPAITVAIKEGAEADEDGKQ